MRKQIVVEANPPRIDRNVVISGKTIAVVQTTHKKGKVRSKFSLSVKESFLKIS